MHPCVVAARVTVVAACSAACWAAEARAQIVLLSRSSHLVSDDGSANPPHVDQTYTALVSETHSLPAASETTAFSPNAITVTGSVYGSSHYSQMQHSGWTSVGQYSGDFTFELVNPASYSLSGYLDTLAGAGSLRLYNLQTGVDVYAYTYSYTAFPRSVFSTSGALPAGQYGLHIDAQGYAWDSLGGAVGISVNLTVTPTPGAAALLAVGGVGCLRRLRRG